MRIDASRIRERDRTNSRVRGLHIKVESVRLLTTRIVHANAILSNDIQRDHHRERTGGYTLNLAATQRRRAATGDEYRDCQAALEVTARDLHTLIAVTSGWCRWRDGTDRPAGRLHIEVESIRLLAAGVVHPDAVRSEERR